jgi:hypothetical protein
MSCSLETRGGAHAQPARFGRALAGMALLVVASMSPFPATAQGKDDLWEVTTKMEMPGMPMAMPPQTVRQCLAKGAEDADYVTRLPRRTGNRIAFKMVCTGTDAMEATGEITLGAESYDGRIQMVMRKDGESLDMSSTFTGKRIGACTAPAQRGDAGISAAGLPSGWV